MCWRSSYQFPLQRRCLGALQVEFWWILGSFYSSSQASEGVKLDDAQVVQVQPVEKVKAEI